MTWPAQHSAEIHQALIPCPRIAGRKCCIGGRLSLLRRQAATGDASQNAGDVGLDDRRIGLERECQNSACCVFADTWQLQQRVESRRKLAQRNNLDRRSMEVPGPTRIAESLPQPEHIAERSVSTLRRRRVGRDEIVPLRDHPRRLGLLQRHLADQDRPRIAQATPRQIAQSRQSPPQDRSHMFEATRHGRDALHSTQSVQTSVPSYGRRRDGTLSRFQTITRRRK